MNKVKIPAKWVVRVTPNNQATLTAWKKSKGFHDPAGHYEFIEECGGGCHYEPHELENSDKTLITFDFFQQYILNPSNNTEDLPEKWYIKGGYELEEFLKEFGANLSGNLNGSGYFIVNNDFHHWDYKYLDRLLDYNEITVEQLKKVIDKLLNKTSLKTVKIMQTTDKKTKANTYFNKENQIVKYRTDGTTTFTLDIVKETSTVRTIPLQSVSYSRKDKLKQNPITKTVEREVIISVIADDEGNLYTGYAIKNPNDKKVSDNLGREIARNRAINSRTNLTPHDTISQNLASKQVLKGIAETFFERLSKGSIVLEGVK